MGNYECINCNEIFHRDEPPYDGYDLCELCSKRTMIMNWKYIVWVGGVDDYYKKYSDAKNAYDEWIAKGYDQVKIERIIK